MFNWSKNINNLSNILEEIRITDISGEIVSDFDGFNRWRSMGENAKINNKTIFFVGNGASASMASHFSADIQKNASIYTRIFTDLSQFSAYANDISYENVFAAPLEMYLKEGDILIAISSSGESPNILKAVETAYNKGGIIVTLSAMNPVNNLSKKGHLNFYFSAKTYGMAETCHATLLHFWTDMLTK